MCCATSATGMTSVLPGTFAHQVLCISMCAACRGMFSRPSDSLTIRDLCASSHALRSVSGPWATGCMSRVGRK